MNYEARMVGSDEPLVLTDETGTRDARKWLIAVAAIAAMQGLGNNLTKTFNNVASNMKST